MDPAAADRRYVRPAEAAKLYGVSVASIRKEVRAGRLAAHRLGRRVLIPVEALESLVRGEPAAREETHVQQ